MLTKINLPSPTPQSRQCQIAGLLADAIINLQPSLQVSRHNSETFSETHESSLDSSANSGLSVTTPNVSAAKPTNQGVFNEA
jgi:hypothetical protein